MYRRLVERDFKRRFVCITFDDGYRDLLQYAWPILKKNNVPFALYVPTGFPDRIGELWWVALERIVANNDRIGLYVDGRDQRFDCVTVDEKRNIYDQLYWWLRSRADRRGIARGDPRSVGALRCRPESPVRRIVHDLGGYRRTLARSAGHHRRPYRQSSDAEKDQRSRRAFRNGNEPRRDRVGDRHPARSFRLSGRRPDLGRARANSRWPPNSASRPR